MCCVGGVTGVNWVVREGLFEKVTFALRLGLKKECSQLRAQ